VNVCVDESAQVASMEHDDNSWNCRYDLPPRVCITGGADLSRAVCAGQHTSVDQSMTADNGFTSQHTAPRRRYAQLRGNGLDWIGLDWIEQGLTSPPTQYRLSGRQFYRSHTHSQPTASKY